MTRDDVLRMAKAVGIKGPSSYRQGYMMYSSPYKLEAFAALVAAHEREECAKVCEQRRGMRERYCAEAIRARGES